MGEEKEGKSDRYLLTCKWL